MKVLFNCLLGICLLFHWNKAKAIGYTFESEQVKFRLAYWMENHLFLSMQKIRNTLKATLRQPFHAVSFKDIFRKAKEGDKESRLFLTYLYLDKFLESQYTESYPSHFEEMKLTDEDIRSIQSFFRKTPLSYEWNFIEGWAEFFLQETLHTTEEKLPYLQKSFSHFLIAKEGGYQEFQFLWAFLIIEMREYFDNDSLEEAERAVFSLAENGYAPAQHLMGFMEMKNNRILSALEWFKKSHKNDFKRDSCSIAIGKIYMDLKESSKAIPYFEAVVYEYRYDFLKPELMRAYINQDQISSAFDVAKEIAENYTKFSFDISLNSMQFLSFILFAVQKKRTDLLESYTWLNRAHLIAEENNISMTVKYNHSDALRSQLSLSEQKEVRRRAERLHQPAKTYSQMDTHLNECKVIFH